MKAERNFIFAGRYRLEVKNNGFTLWDMKSRFSDAVCERWMIDASSIALDGVFMLGCHKWNSCATVKKIITEYIHDAYEPVPKHKQLKKRKEKKR